MALSAISPQNDQAAAYRAAYDAACKRLLSEKMILAWIMKSCLEEYKSCSVREIAEHFIEGSPQIGEIPVMPEEESSIIQGMDTEDKSLTEGTVTYDIRFYALAPGSGERIRLIINLEAQLDFYPGYPLLKRGLYYCSRMISSQYGREFSNSHYEKIKKVYSVWICIDPPKNRRNTITSYQMYEKNIVGSVQEKVQDYDLLSVVMVCLGGAEAGCYDGLLRLLDVLLSSEKDAQEKRKILLDDYDIKMTHSFESEVSEMCNLSQGVWDKGVQKGMELGKELGKEIGKEIGREMGREESRMFSLQSLMKTMNWTAEQAMAALEIPSGERQKYLSLLAEHQPS